MERLGLETSETPPSPSPSPTYSPCLAPLVATPFLSHLPVSQLPPSQPSLHPLPPPLPPSDTAPGSSSSRHQPSDENIQHSLVTLSVTSECLCATHPSVCLASAPVCDAMQMLRAMVVAARSSHLNPQSPCTWLHVAPCSPHSAPSCSPPLLHHQPLRSGQTLQDVHAC